MNIIDIDTSNLPALVIKDDKQLSDLVFEIASKQLLLNAAEAEQQSKIEAAKKAFADATGDISAEISAKFAAIEAYAAKHKDRLFPVKAGKRKKTFAVLAHKLQYRSSEQVKAPSNAVAVLKSIILNSEVEIMNLGPCEHSTAIAAMISRLEPLIRQPEPELNKDAVKAEQDVWTRDLLAAHGITVETLETFKLTFAFTPDQEAN
jgi:phage host-nuclease inhibitor protein Gam